MIFDRLPRESIVGEFPRSALERLGFQFHGDIDDLFFSVTPPYGWTLRETEHQLYTEILDNLGRVRGEIFYKAAAYDRRADLDMYQRNDLKSESSEDAARVTINDRLRVADHALFATAWSYRGSRTAEDWRRMNAECEGWLDERFSDWRNVDAYWNDLQDLADASRDV